MQLFVRAIVTGFGLSIGAFAWKKLSKRFGLDNDQDDAKKNDAPSVHAQDGATDPGLRA
jgi:hypothetical protein